MNEIISGIGQSILNVFSVTWWIFIPLALGFIFWQFWLYHVIVKYLRAQKWVLLEIKIPQGIEKTPKAMEQVFAAFYQIYSFGLKFMEKYRDGKLVEDFISCEIVGHAGAVNFYIRTIERYRNIVESAIYSQYPDAEILEAQDYRALWPKTLPNEIYDIAGTDYQLVKDGPYPIRTYEYFESAQDEKRLDPIAALTEVMSNLKEDEALWVQILVRPIDHSWIEDGQELVAKLAGREKAAKRTFFDGVAQLARNLIVAPFEHPTWPEVKKKEEKSRMLLLTPGEKEILEGIEMKISKIGFETNIRFVYIDKRNSFSPLNVSATMSTFNQFNTLDMNSFMPKIKTFTLTPAGYKGIFSFLFQNIKFLKSRIIWFRKRQLWDYYMKMRWSGGKRPILNIEELATIYHFPSIVVEAPLLRRVPSKRGEPPAGLPVE